VTSVGPGTPPSGRRPPVWLGVETVAIMLGSSQRWMPIVLTSVGAARLVPTAVRHDRMPTSRPRQRPIGMRVHRTAA
jgi:hypothetical protein